LIILGSSVNDEIVAVADSKYNTAVLSSNSLYIFFKVGFLSSISFLASILSSNTNLPDILIHLPSLKAHISTFGFFSICLKTSFFFPVWIYKWFSNISAVPNGLTLGLSWSIVAK